MKKQCVITGHATVYNEEKKLETRHSLTKKYCPVRVDQNTPHLTKWQEAIFQDGLNRYYRIQQEFHLNLALLIIYIILP